MNVSVVMPYWERAESLRASLYCYCSLYHNEVEVIVVDDGSPTEPARPVADEYRFFLNDIKVIELPKKTMPLNPCTPINAGVEAAGGEYIVLTSPEVQHHHPAIREMASLCEENKNSVVNMPVRTTDGTWLSRPGRCYPYFSMFHRLLWEAVGGYDEQFRNGYCFDDDDWLMALSKHGASHLWIDSTCGEIENNDKNKVIRPREEWKINYDKFVSKWGRDPVAGGKFS